MCLAVWRLQDTAVSRPRLTKPLPQIGFLHTAETHVDTFTALAHARGLSTVHRVEEAWLAEASEQGLGNDLTLKVQKALSNLRAECDAVICTCSTLGTLAESLHDPHVFRIDEPMMANAAAIGPQVLLVYCLDSTKETSVELLTQAFAKRPKATSTSAAVTPLHCQNAWPFFEAAQYKKFGQAIADHILDQPHTDYSCIVLAQASMTAALPYLENSVEIPILSSPASAMDFAQQLLS